MHFSSYPCNSPCKIVCTIPQIQIAIIGEKSIINTCSLTGKTENPSTDTHSLVMTINSNLLVNIDNNDKTINKKNLKELYNKHCGQK